MNPQLQPNSRTKDLHWVPNWLPQLEVVGKYQIPQMQHTNAPNFEEVRAFTRASEISRPEKFALHGWVDDFKLEPLRNNPGRYIKRFSAYAAVITPDFSVLSEMPPQERIRAVWNSRAIGRYFQSRGLTVIPTVRWATMSDLIFSLEGLPKHSTIAISSQGLLRDRGLKRVFINGIGTVIDQLELENLVFYGPTCQEIETTLESVPNVHWFGTDISRVFDERKH